MSKNYSAAGANHIRGRGGGVGEGEGRSERVRVGDGGGGCAHVRRVCKIQHLQDRHFFFIVS